MLLFFHSQLKSHLAVKWLQGAFQQTWRKISVSGLHPFPQCPQPLRRQALLPVVRLVWTFVCLLMITCEHCRKATTTCLHSVSVCSNRSGCLLIKQIPQLSYNCAVCINQPSLRINQPLLLESMSRVERGYTYTVSLVKQTAIPLPLLWLMFDSLTLAVASSLSNTVLRQVNLAFWDLHLYRFCNLQSCVAHYTSI